MPNYAPITTQVLFDGVQMSLGLARLSVPLDLRLVAPSYRFSLELIVIGAGHIYARYHVSGAKDGQFRLPTGGPAAGDIITETTSTYNMIGFTPILTPFMKIRVAETGIGLISSLTVRLHVQ